MHEQPRELQPQLHIFRNERRRLFQPHALFVQFARAFVKFDELQVATEVAWRLLHLLLPLFLHLHLYVLTLCETDDLPEQFRAQPVTRSGEGDRALQCLHRFTGTARRAVQLRDLLERCRTLWRLRVLDDEFEMPNRRLGQMVVCIRARETTA